MKFPQNFLAGARVLTAGAGVLTAGAGGEMMEFAHLYLMFSKVSN